MLTLNLVQFILSIMAVLAADTNWRSGPFGIDVLLYAGSIHDVGEWHGYCSTAANRSIHTGANVWNVYWSNALLGFGNYFLLNV